MAEWSGFSVERSIASTRPTVAGGGLSEPGWSRRGLRFGGGGDYSGWLNGADGGLFSEIWVDVFTIVNTMTI